MNMLVIITLSSVVVPIIRKLKEKINKTVQYTKVNLYTNNAQKYSTNGKRL